MGEKQERDSDSEVRIRIPLYFCTKTLHQRQTLLWLSELSWFRCSMTMCIRWVWEVIHIVMVHLNHDNVNNLVPNA